VVAAAFAAVMPLVLHAFEVRGVLRAMIAATAF
jgi:hypothetical protein